MNNKIRFKAVIFDLDGVIVDTAKYHYIAWKSMAEDLGIAFTEADNEHLKGISRMDSLNYILQMGNLFYANEKKLQLAHRKNQEYLKLINHLDPSEILPGTMNWLNKCKKHNIHIALGSASKNARQILSGLNLMDYFEVIIDGTDTTKTKPNPEVFLLAAEKLGLPPVDCVVVEDSFRGIEAALAGGFFTVGIGDKEILKDAHIVSNSLENIDPEKLFDPKTDQNLTPLN